MSLCSPLSYKPFNVLRNSKIFVDKTFLIQKFLAGQSRHLLITAPRGFGKTTNLDMVRRFAEIDVLPNGTMKTDKKTHKNYKTFAEVVPSTRKLLNTFRGKKFFQKHFGEYPVIYLNLDPKGVKTASKAAFVRQLLNGPIREAFVDHLYLLSSSVISTKDKDLMRQFLHPEGLNKEGGLTQQNFLSELHTKRVGHQESVSTSQEDGHILHLQEHPSVGVDFREGVSAKDKDRRLLNLQERAAKELKTQKDIYITENNQQILSLQERAAMRHKAQKDISITDKSRRFLSLQEHAAMQPEAQEDIFIADKSRQFLNLQEHSRPRIASEESIPTKVLTAQNFLHPAANVLGIGPREGISLLKRLLKEHFQRDPIALVDNIDFPIQEAIFDPNCTIALDKIYEVGDLLRALPDWDLRAKAEPTQRTLLTGVLQPFHMSNAYKYLSRAIDELTIDFYHIYQEEVDLLVKSIGLEHKLNEIKAWYGGFGSNLKGSIYNPYSIYSFLASETKELRPYWTDLVTLEAFKLALHPDCFGKYIMQCLDKCYLRNEWYTMSQTWTDFRGGTLPNSTTLLQDLQNPSPGLCTNGTAYRFISFLEQCGYLHYLGVNIPVDESDMFQVPNSEVRQYLSKLLFEAVVEQAPLNGHADFRVQFFDAITGVDGTEPAMRRLADILSFLYSNEAGLTSEGTSLHPETQFLLMDKGTFLHIVRVHLLNPPAGYRVRYVKMGLSVEEMEARRDEPAFDLVFVVESGKGLLSFVIKVGVGNIEAAERVLTDAYFDVFTSGDLRDLYADATKIVANFRCGTSECGLCYLYDSRDLEQEKFVRIDIH